jgi:hypothetical protein
LRKDLLIIGSNNGREVLREVSKYMQQPEEKGILRRF